MPANTEETVFARGLPAWHGTGTVLPDDAMDFETIARHVPQIEMPVEPCPIYYIAADGKPVRIEDQVANVRADGTYLGVVGEGYRAVQGREAFGFLSELLRPGGDGLREVIADTAGTLDGGRKMFIACRASRQFYVAGQDSESHTGYMTFLNSFDGSTRVGAVVSTVRTVCENTFNANLSGHKAAYWFRHTVSVGERIAEARRALSVAGRYWSAYEDQCNKLVRAPLASADWDRLLDHLVADPSKLQDKARAQANAEREREELTLLYVNAPDVQNVRGTAYAALQACTAWSDHFVRGRRSEKSSIAENRTRRILLDASFKQKAYDAICEMAEVR